MEAVAVVVVGEAAGEDVVADAVADAAGAEKPCKYHSRFHSNTSQLIGIMTCLTCSIKDAKSARAQSPLWRGLGELQTRERAKHAIYCP